MIYQGMVGPGMWWWYMVWFLTITFVGCFATTCLPIFHHLPMLLRPSGISEVGPGWLAHGHLTIVWISDEIPNLLLTPMVAFPLSCGVTLQLRCIPICKFWLIPSSPQKCFLPFFSHVWGDLPSKGWVQPIVGSAPHTLGKRPIS